ncbi:MAG: hypothetical protein ACI3VB_09940 [Oscillospiraceae bacterium]
MKKCIAIILALTCVSCLAGCSPNEYITGTIKFYSEPTKEFTDPVSVISIKLSNEQAKEIKTAINNVNEWTNDYTVNRLEYYFDGELNFSDSNTVYYFSYEYNLIYYDHYFAGIAAEEMQYIKDMGMSAKDSSEVSVRYDHGYIFKGW